MIVITFTVDSVVAPKKSLKRWMSSVATKRALNGRRKAVKASRRPCSCRRPNSCAAFSLVFVAYRFAFFFFVNNNFKKNLLCLQPDWAVAAIAQAALDEEKKLTSVETLGRGQRARADVQYFDTMTENQWLMMVCASRL